MLTIVMTTYFPPGSDGLLRHEAVDEAVESWADNLSYDGRINLHVADDGSDGPDLYLDWLRLGAREQVFGTVSRSQQHRHGVGASLNAGFRQAFETSPLVLYAVDDWKLTADLDLTPWANLLMEREDIGMVRLGLPHPWLTGNVEHDAGRWWLNVDRHHFAFGHRPALYHRRMIGTYGWFKEGVNAYDCEIDYNDRFCAAKVPPGIALAFLHPWEHVESIELAHVEPG